ncbi:hypothetical protein AB0O05_41370 [Streptomyces sp. NPDC093084]
MDSDDQQLLRGRIPRHGARADRARRALYDPRLGDPARWDWGGDSP